MAQVGQRSRDSDLTAFDGNDMNNASDVNGRRILENPLATPEKGQAKRKGDEEAQVVVNEKASLSDSSIKVYVRFTGLHQSVLKSCITSVNNSRGSKQRVLCSREFIVPSCVT